MRLRPLHKFLKRKMRIPQPVTRPVLRRLRLLGRRAEHARRLALAREILQTSPHAETIPRRLGYQRFEAHDFPGIPAAVARCAQVFASGRPVDPLFQRKASFLQVVAHGEQLTAHREILQLMVSRPIVDAVTGYLEAVPLLVGAALLWSPANASAESSQLFHVDDEDDRMVKAFVNIWEVTPAHGPLTLLPADASERVCERTGPIVKRASDESVLGAADGARPVSICGKPGDGVLVDTARCLHYGSRGNEKERLVLQLHFLRDDAPSEPSIPCGFPADLAGLVPDPVQRLVLGLPEA